MNALQVLAACKEQSLSLSSYALLRESAQSGTPEKDVEPKDYVPIKDR